ncbi:MAG TPA: hypothetical protein VFO39_02300 [Candidatus Sulfotelmatobacter sp.]|nr:hypothetical protein [Candidatus Sulfotelmatobacter sp.]
MTPISNNPAPKCFANLHLTPEEFGLWEYLRSISYSTGVAYLSGRRIASDFVDTNKNAVYRIIDRLFEKGWLEEFSAFYRTKSGVYVPRSATVLTHESWVLKHGTADCRPVPKSGQVGPVPVRGLSRNQGTPVPNLGRSCPEIGNNTAVDSAFDSAKVEVVEKNAPLPLSGKSKPADKDGVSLDHERLFHEMRRMWREALGGAAYNTTPVQDGKLIRLAERHGLADFLGGYALWLKNDADDQIETRPCENLKFPMRKFLEQASTYIEEFHKDDGGCRTHKNYAYVFDIARSLQLIPNVTEGALADVAL